MVKFFVPFLLTLCVINSNAQSSTLMTQVPKFPSLFGKGWISTEMNERDFAISPDYKEIYFTLSTPKSDLQTIVYTKINNQGEWSIPEVVSFAGRYSDLEPAFSSDGKTLFFVSNRPITSKVEKDFDIWYVTRVGERWSEPKNVGAPINTEADEFYPSVALNGNLYFTANYKNLGLGREDIYLSKFINNQFEKPIALDSAINSKFDEFNAFVSPSEEYILFSSYGRKDDYGGGDLYISVKNESGKWTKAVNIIECNSNYLEYCPYVSPDGEKLFFTSNRYKKYDEERKNNINYQFMRNMWRAEENGFGNIYWIDFKMLLNKYMN